jgi:hypothetical protein
MKKLIFLLPLMCTIIAFSQTEKRITKGNMIISGGVAVAYSETKVTASGYSSTNSIFELTLNPGISYFFIDNLAIGLNTDFIYYSQGNNKYYSLGIGPAIKYYFGNGILIKGESTYTWFKGLGSNDTYKNHYFTFKPGVGYAFFINSKVSLEPSVNYQFQSYKDLGGSNDYTAKTNSLQLELTIVVFL